MRFMNLKLPKWVAAGLLTAATISSATGQEQSGLPPVQAAVPQEDAYQMRALPPHEAAEEVAE